MINDRLVFASEPPLRPFLGEDMTSPIKIRTRELTTDMTLLDKEFINRLHHKIDMYGCENYSDPKYIVVGEKMLVSIFRYNYNSMPGVIEYNSFHGIPVICAKLPPNDFYVVGGDNRKTFNDYIFNDGEV